MNIYEKIKQDHDYHRKLLQQIEDTSGDSEERRKLFEELFREVESHAAAEEQTLYAELIEDQDAQQQARHSIVEHDEATDLIEELQTTDMSSPAWLQTFKKLRKSLEHHMEEEEQDVFEQSDEVISDQRANELGEKFSQRKSQEKSSL